METIQTMPLFIEIRSDPTRSDQIGFFPFDRVVLDERKGATNTDEIRKSKGNKLAIGRDGIIVFARVCLCDGVALNVSDDRDQDGRNQKLAYGLDVEEERKFGVRDSGFDIANNSHSLFVQREPP